MGAFASRISQTWDPTTQIPNLNGKIILVTGGNAGIGASFVKLLAAHSPAAIYIAARTKSTAEGIVKEIQNANASSQTRLEILPLDLSSLKSVKSCATEFTRKENRLDLLFLNAGISATSPGTTSEGYEKQFGINHLGHALLTQLLLPTLLSTSKQPNSDVRTILTSSVGGHTFLPKNGLELEKMKGPCPELSPVVKYGHSKLANILFGLSLSKKYPSILTTSHHPGTVMSEIWSKGTGIKTLLWIIWPVVLATGVTCDEGAKSGLWCATAEREKVVNGGYYEPVGKFGKECKGKSKFARDEKLAEELWGWTNRELGVGWP